MTAHLLDLEAVESTLLAKAEECRETLRQMRNELQVQGGGDRLDSSLRALDREAAAERVESCNRLLKQIELALGRLQRGLFGKCLKCKELISAKRLAAIPWALFCAACQDEVDRFQYNARSWGLQPGRMA